jgi:hypothetical protein
VVTPAAGRRQRPQGGNQQAVAHLQAAFEVSERRACDVLGVDRTMVRYASRRPDDADVRERMRSLAAASAVRLPSLALAAGS